MKHGNEHGTQIRHRYGDTGHPKKVGHDDINMHIFIRVIYMVHIKTHNH